MKKIQETMKKKYICDRSITVTRLEDLVQDAAVGTLHLYVTVKHVCINFPEQASPGYERSSQFQRILLAESPLT